MNRQTFFEWLAFHDAAFPGFHNWWFSVEESAIEIRLNLWLGRVSQFSLGQLQQATELMFSSPDKPKYHSEHLDWICARLRPRPLLNSTEQTAAPKKCRLCLDTGIVTVIFREQRFTPAGVPLPDNTGPVACKCSVGQWLNDRRSKSPNGVQLEVLNLQLMDLPQPLQLTDTERDAIEERVRARNPGLAQVLRRFSNNIMERRSI